VVKTSPRLAAVHMRPARGLGVTRLFPAPTVECRTFSYVPLTGKLPYVTHGTVKSVTLRRLTGLRPFEAAREIGERAFPRREAGEQPRSCVVASA
jgi:hypothetical protein